MKMKGNFSHNIQKLSVSSMIWAEFSLRSFHKRICYLRDVSVKSSFWARMKVSCYFCTLTVELGFIFKWQNHLSWLWHRQMVSLDNHLILSQQSVFLVIHLNICFYWCKFTLHVVHTLKTSSVQHFQTFLYQDFSYVISSGSTGRVRGDQEIWNLCGHLW